MKYCKINDLAMAHNVLNVTFYGTSDANCVTLEDTYIICHIAAASAYPLAAASAYPPGGGQCLPPGGGHAGRRANLMQTRARAGPTYPTLEKFDF